MIEFIVKQYGLSPLEATHLLGFVKKRLGKLDGPTLEAATLDEIKFLLSSTFDNFMIWHEQYEDDTGNKVVGNLKD